MPPHSTAASPPHVRCARRRLWRLALAALLLTGCEAPNMHRSGIGESAGHDASIYDELHYWPLQEPAQDDGELCVPASLIGLADDPYGDGHDDLWSRLRAGYGLGGRVDERRVDQYIDTYSDKQRLFDRLGSDASPFLHYVVEELEQRNMPLEIALLPIIESGYNPEAVSPGKAAGLWQIVPGTASTMGLEHNGWYDGRKDVVASTEAALDYLEELHRRFDGDWYLALAAYNTGEGNVQRAIEQNRRLGKPTDYWSLPLSRQACNYVPKLLALSRVLEAPQDHGISLSPMANEVSVVPVEVNKQVDLHRAATRAGIDSRELMSLNPAYKRGFTAPDTSSTLLVPAEDKQNFLAAVSGQAVGNAPVVSAHPEHYRVRSGDTLRAIARLHQTTPEALRSLNRLEDDRIAAGQELLIPADAIVPPRRFPTAESVALKNHGLYTVKPGDSLSQIAKRFGTSTQQLAALNTIGTGSTLRVGQKLKVRDGLARDPAVAATATADGRLRVSYTVKGGDSVARIADRFNVAVKQVLAWNGMNPARPLIHPGQVLVLYVEQKLAEARKPG
ncbi:MAG: LysM peptidoglycan-binding domain-containing protein [Pseudomonadales bacterium]|jgi:membrane-bound lytic murein transglycosylase D|nr:LysM peptidoglycan-binding domain-containing protein [Pseudomonadales bacterium]MBP7911420.1 LysM peptidoglycan-binding domain-containing protein [Pseudomonadales bacterium]